MWLCYRMDLRTGFTFSATICANNKSIPLVVLTKDNARFSEAEETRAREYMPGILFLSSPSGKMTGELW